MRAEFSFTQLLSVPVYSIALAEPAHVAVLADAPYVGDARGLLVIPLPPSLRPKADQRDECRIFFGRDNEPRIMGTRYTNDAEQPIYFRHTSSGWRDGREELGQLASASRGGLWGVLGADDPELVCRAGSVCIIKRASGWTTAPAGATRRSVVLQAGTLWGLDDSGLANIDAHGWTLAIPGPAWTRPTAFWATKEQAWVAASQKLFHYRAGSWSELSAPIAGPRAFWGVSSDSVWLVGAGGAAHFDGKSWHLLSLSGPLEVVAGRAKGELWFG
ncbi:MAG TPA: hypothetical protein VGM44_13330, partial [Polyangiaceae bacterium]